MIDKNHNKQRAGQAHKPDPVTAFSLVNKKTTADGHLSRAAFSSRDLRTRENTCGLTHPVLSLKQEEFERAALNSSTQG